MDRPSAPSIRYCKKFCRWLRPNYGNAKMGKPEVGNAFAKVSHTRFCIFPRNLAPDFLQYISGKSKSEVFWQKKWI